MKLTQLLKAVSLFTVITSTFIPVQADWINLTGAETSPNIAEIYVLDDHIKVKLEVYVGDLETFEELVPDDWVKELDIQQPPLEQRIKHFANHTLKFIPDKGKPLSAQLVLVEPRMRVDRQSPFAGMINPMTRQRVPEAPADKRVLYAEVIYPFEGKPKQLTMVPPLDAEGRAQERIFDVAASDGRVPDPTTHRVAPLASTVDAARATYSNTIGAAILAGFWEDPDFDPAENAFYYVRVIEIPKPRWTTYDAAFFGIPLPEQVPPSVQDRAYTSPIWYAAGG